MFLREQIIYSSTFYYFAVIENIILRFFWVVSIYLATQDYITAYNLDSLIGCLEIIRYMRKNFLKSIYFKMLFCKALYLELYTFGK